MKKDEVTVTTNYNTGDHDTFQINEEDLFFAQAKAIDEAIDRGYDHEDIKDVVEIDENTQEKIGKESVRLWYRDIEYFFSVDPESFIPEYYREKIDNGDMWLTIDFDHDNQTVSWYYEESNNAHTSTEDVYDEVLEAIQEIQEKNN
jgi:hypothetical protein